MYLQQFFRFVKSFWPVPGKIRRLIPGGAGKLAAEMAFLRTNQAWRSLNTPFSYP